LDFIEQYQNTRWPKFKSNKVCDLKYGSKQVYQELLEVEQKKIPQSMDPKQQANMVKPIVIPAKD
jgi:hypothetical protein